MIPAAYPPLCLHQHLPPGWRHVVALIVIGFAPEWAAGDVETWLLVAIPTLTLQTGFMILSSPSYLL
jgi:hypothetical protein